MKVTVFFQYYLSGKDHVVFGKYKECGFIFEEGVELQAFFTLPNHTYHKTEFSMGLVSKWKEEGLTLDCLLLDLDMEEMRKVRATCEACAQSVKPFNLYDVVMMLVPFWVPEEIPLYEAKTLNNTQALILILRECLNEENPLRKALEGMNSRKTCLNSVFERLAAHAQSMNIA